MSLLDLLPMRNLVPDMITEQEAEDVHKRIVTEQGYGIKSVQNELQFLRGSRLLRKAEGR